MFRFDYDKKRWIPFSKKITYTQTIESFDDTSEGYPDGAIIEDLTLTEEESRRLEVVSQVVDISLPDLIRYVKGEVMEETPTEALIKAEEKQKQVDTIKSLVDFETAPIEVLETLNILKKDWDIGIWLEVNDLVEYQDALYIVIQAHRTQDDWRPDEVPALYKVKRAGTGGDTESQPEIYVQPLGSHDAYQIGDRVLWIDGLVYVCKIANCVWSPVDYPQAWEAER